MPELEHCELLLPVDASGTPLGPVHYRRTCGATIEERDVTGSLDDAARRMRADGWRFVYGERRREGEGRCLVVLEWVRGQ